MLMTLLLQAVDTSLTVWSAGHQHLPEQKPESTAGLSKLLRKHSERTIKVEFMVSGSQNVVFLKFILTTYVSIGRCQVFPLKIQT